MMGDVTAKAEGIKDQAIMRQSTVKKMEGNTSSIPLCNHSISISIPVKSKNSPCIIVKYNIFESF